MKISKAELVLQALHDRLIKSLPGTRVLRNESVPLQIEETGLVILRDGDPGEGDFIHSPPTWFYEHRAEVEIYVERTEPKDRDFAFDLIKVAIAAGLESDRTLGGLVDYAVGENPSNAELSEMGMPGVKAASIIIVLPYDTSDPLA